MKKYILMFSLLALFVMPYFSSAVESELAPNELTGSCFSLAYNMRYQYRDAMTNGEVSTLQDFLQAKGYLNNEPTGYFGLLTASAVKAFQNANGIESTGYVGLLTRAKIKLISCDPSNISIVYKQSGCDGGAVYSSTTGEKCNNKFPSGCTSTVGFSATTGYRCDGSTKPPVEKYPSGCSSYEGFSATTGERCSVKTSQSDFEIYNTAKWVAQAGYSYTTALLVFGGPSGVSTNMINWSVSSGSLPPGLILAGSDDGEVITGTPTKAGVYKFSITASTKSLHESTGVEYETDTKPFTITVLSTAISNCTSGGYDATTGLRCGCSSTAGYSSVDGKYCGLDLHTFLIVSDAYIKASLSSARSQAEIYYDTHGSYSGVCTSTGGVAKLVAQANEKGTKADSPCDDSKTAWAANVKLKTSGAGYWCVDSTGLSKNTDSDKGSSLSCEGLLVEVADCPVGGYNPYNGSYCGEEQEVPAEQNCSVDGYTSAGFRCGCTSTVGYSSVSGASCSLP